MVRAIDADKAYGFLLDALKRRARPTIVLIYGDHLPALPLVYEQLGFKRTANPPEEHFPPYRVWANFPVPPAPDHTTSYLLQGWLMRAAGLPLRGHELANALAGIVANDSATSAADRQRVLSEYANVAAETVRRTPRQGRADKTFVGQTRALGLLLKRATQRPANAVVASDSGDLRLTPGSSGRSAVTFLLDARLATLTLRPYVGAATPAVPH